MSNSDDIDIGAEVLAQATDQECWCADTRKRCQYHDGVEDGMFHMYDRLTDEIERLQDKDEAVGRVLERNAELEAEVTRLRAKVAFAYDHHAWNGDSDFLRWRLDNWEEPDD